MTKYRFNLFLLVIAMVISMTSCNRDEVLVEPPIVLAKSGVYVLSEGGFSPGTSKLSYFDFESEQFNVNIFNPGSLGLFPDGILLDEGNLYITEQGNFGAPGKIYKTDTNGTVIRSSSIGINPFAVTFSNGRLYISNGPSNTVSAINRENLQILSTIPVRNYPQEILGINNRVFVCNFGSFSTGNDSVVSVIDAGNNQVVGNIIVGKNPSSLARSADGKLLVGCPGDSSRAVIYKVDPLTLAKLDTFKNLTFGLSKDIIATGSNLIHFIGGDLYVDKDIIEYNISTGVSRVLIPQPSGYFNYGLATDPANSNIYVAQAASDFASSGRLRIYSSGGVLARELVITDGIAPRRIIVKR
ncbi:MAG: YncE family protein [Ignavibacteria bacterium]|nr:YncE family protein [Ignavibacteria bacterium]